MPDTPHCSLPDSQLSLEKKGNWNCFVFLCCIVFKWKDANKGQKSLFHFQTQFHVGVELIAMLTCALKKHVKQKSKFIVKAIKLILIALTT